MTTLGKCDRCKVEVYADLVNRCRDRECPGLPGRPVQVFPPLTAEERQSMYAKRRGGAS